MPWHWMTPEEEAYEAALAYSGSPAPHPQSGGEPAVELDLTNKTAEHRNTLAPLNRLRPELARLTSLQRLNLSWFFNLNGDFSSLAELTSLQSLDLSYYRQLSDLSPLAGLTTTTTEMDAGKWDFATGHNGK